MDSARRVLVGVTGGIAAYKVPLLVRLLRKSGCEVKTVLTSAAKTLVGIDALRTLSGNPVYQDGEFQYDMDHIRLSEWADVFVICPATANTIAKIACGIADNLLTTLALSIPENKIIVAPAMNSVMWANRATQANVSTLKDRGIEVLPVEDGELACGVSGPGRMVEIDEIARRVLSHNGGVDVSGTACNNDDTGSKPAPNSSTSISTNDTVPIVPAVPNVLNVLNKAPDDDEAPRTCGVPPPAIAPAAVPPDKINLLRGINILISSGPTEEPIDPVRVITNRSSGKMGAALALAARDMGAVVTVVTGPASEPLPVGVDVIPVRTAAEMEREMVKKFDSADICVMAAAVSDFRPVSASDTKLHRSEDENLALELTPNPDIAARLGAAKKPAQFLIGFALESGSDISRAVDKMKKKNCDMMVFNRVEDALGGGRTVFTILARNCKWNFPVMDKTEAARIILEMAHSTMKIGVAGGE